MGAFEKSEAVVRTRRLWLFVAMIAASVGALASLPVLGFESSTFWLAYISHFVMALGLAIAWRRWLVERRSRLGANADGLHLEGRLEVPRSTIRAAHVHRRGGQAFVRLVRTLRSVDVLVDDELEGDALVTALRLDAASAVARYTMQDGTLRRALLRGIGIVILNFTLTAAAMPLLFVHPALFLAAVALSSAAFVVLALRSHLLIYVGADGMRMKRRCGGSRFLRYADIERVVTDAPNIVLHLRDGTRVTMSKGMPGKWKKRLSNDEQTDEAEGFVERVNRRIADHRAHDDAAVRDSLARAGRSTAQWLHDLGLTHETVASFRTSAIPHDVLWGVVEDTTAAPSARVGAAVALSGGPLRGDALDDTTRTRLRLAAEACAAPRLRVALETAAADADDATALAAALDEIADEPEAKRLQMR